MTADRRSTEEEFAVRYAGKSGGAGESGSGGEATSAGGEGGGDDVTPGSAGEPSSGGEGGAPVEEAAWYECQVSEQAFVRRAMLGVLGHKSVHQVFQITFLYQN